LPVIGNAFIISLGNTLFSFICGFAVFSVVGYLVGLGSPVASEVSSIGLAFIAYPAAIGTLKGANFWSMMFAATLFILGIDSAFAIIEATSTVICDTTIGKNLSKAKIAFTLCFVGTLCSTVFCFNWGFTAFDIIDHYLNVYLVLLMGIL
jgi:SNF family Na+-dependent transporter